jgi:8-oxo-dGTP pyrophosphatase MutT (NUDIX family)
VKREFSAGGVVVRRIKGVWHVAAIHPRGRRPGLWALPKGNIDPGETPAETAVREVHEETGVVGKLDEKLGDVKYTYTWDGERIFKIVSFFLVRYSSGRLGDIHPPMDIEVDEARWLPIEEAPKLLAYGGERQMVERAIAALDP